jgi:NTP pyrophosphatase (non-canonical NTP hydrolase)
MTKNERVAIAMEISDILWYIAALACVLGYDLSEIAKFNIEKLRSSLERGATGD